MKNKRWYLIQETWNKNHETNWTKTSYKESCDKACWQEKEYNVVMKGKEKKSIDMMKQNEKETMFEY